AAWAEPGGHGKLDAALQDALQRGGSTHHVIVHPRAGFTDRVCEALDVSGKLRGRHQLIGSCSADVAGDELQRLAGTPFRETRSSDAPLPAHHTPVTHLSTPDAPPPTPG